MRAFEIRSARKASVVDMPEPSISEEEVLVKVAYCGVCGTDLHIFRGEFPVKLPLVPGHEFSGVVEGVGDKVTELKVGDHVSIDPNMNCGDCYYCRRGMTNFCEKWSAIGVTTQGAYAELVSAPASNVYRVPNDAPLERFAFVEPVSCVLHGLDRANPRKGEKVLVTGLGSIGLIFGQLLKERGTEVMGSDLVEERLRMAEKLGFDVTTNPASESVERSVFSWTEGRGADLVVEASGSTNALEGALGLVDKGGRILVFGVAPEDATLSIRPFAIYRNEVSLIGSFTNPLTFSRAVDIIASGKVSVTEIVSRVVDLEGVKSAFEEIGQMRGIKYLVKPG